MARIVGMDLGTTNSVVAAVQAGNPVVIPTAEGGNFCLLHEALHGPPR